MRGEEKMEIERCLTISTAHITERTMSKLENETDVNDMRLVVFSKGEYGYWIYCKDTVIEHGAANGIPEDLLKCMELAWKKNCKWLCLDRDEEVSEELNSYNW